jgi:hypothetical protein
MPFSTKSVLLSLVTLSMVVAITAFLLGCGRSYNRPPARRTDKVLSKKETPKDKKDTNKTADQKRARFFDRTKKEIKNNEVPKQKQGDASETTEVDSTKPPATAVTEIPAVPPGTANAQPQPQKNAPLLAGDSAKAKDELTINKLNLGKPYLLQGVLKAKNSEAKATLSRTVTMVRVKNAIVLYSFENGKNFPLTEFTIKNFVNTSSVVKFKSGLDKLLALPLWQDSAFADHNLISFVDVKTKILNSIVNESNQQLVVKLEGTTVIEAVEPKTEPDIISFELTFFLRPAPTEDPPTAK